MTTAGKFIQDRCVPVDGCTLLSELFGEYIRYALENGLETETQFGFAESLFRLGYPKSHRKPGKTPVIIGLAVKP